MGHRANVCDALSASASPGWRIAAVSRPRTEGARVDESPLACLMASSLGARYHAWHGASGRRYTTSIFPVHQASDGGGLPTFEGVVLIAVLREGTVLRPVHIMAMETAADRKVASSLARGASEWHIHLLAGDVQRRRSIVEDLRERHRPDTVAGYPPEGGATGAKRAATAASVASVMPSSIMCA